MSAHFARVCVVRNEMGNTAKRDRIVETIYCFLDPIVMSRRNFRRSHPAILSIQCLSSTPPRAIHHVLIIFAAPFILGAPLNFGP